MRGIGRLARLEQTQIDAPGFDRQCRITTGATGEWNRVRQIVEVPVGNVLARPFLQRFVARRRLIQPRSCSAVEASAQTIPRVGNPGERALVVSGLQASAPERSEC